MARTHIEHNVRRRWPNKYILVSIHLTEPVNEGPFCVGTAEEEKFSELESGKRVDGACATFDMFSLYWTFGFVSDLRKQQQQQQPHRQCAEIGQHFSWQPATGHYGQKR